MRYLKADTKKPAIYTFGDYPDIPLKVINDLAKAVKSLVKQGIDPTAYREQQKLTTEVQRQATLRAQAHSFETITREWHTHRRDSLNRWKSAKNAEKILHMLEVNLFPDLGISIYTNPRNFLIIGDMSPKKVFKVLINAYRPVTNAWYRNT